MKPCRNAPSTQTRTGRRLIKKQSTGQAMGRSSVFYQKAGMRHERFCTLSCFAYRFQQGHTVMPLGGI